MLIITWDTLIAFSKNLGMVRYHNSCYVSVQNAPIGSVGRIRHNNKRPVLYQDNVNFGNPCGTPQLLQRI